jgi:BirA family biotin operon repressor/biotin-[acetyl-CoA-carboxylase] ligase
VAGPDAISTRFADVRWVAETGSTNADVMALIAGGAPEGIVCVADHQTAGRGRQGRTWSAPPGASLLATVLLRPPAAVAPLVTTALALAACAAVEDRTGIAPQLKWPNDLLVGERKLAGVLAEAAWPAGSDIASGYREPKPHDRAAVAAGIGINCNWPDEFPPEIEATAVALNHLTGAPVDREALLATLLVGLEARYGGLVAEGGAALRAEWRRRSATLGRRVRLEVGIEDVHGTAVDITDDGRLIVDTDDGDRRVFAAGDVIHLRPTS